MTRSPFSPPPCGKARSGRSRDWAAITWPAPPGTPPLSRSCGGGSTVTRSRSRSWSPTPTRPPRSARSGRPSAPCCGRLNVRSFYYANCRLPPPTLPRKGRGGKSLPLAGEGWGGGWIVQRSRRQPLARRDVAVYAAASSPVAGGGRRPARHDQRQPLRRADRLPRRRGAEKLAGIADLFLVHDRPIHVRCDDSVTRVVEGLELPLRRSRGYAPRPIELPVDVLAADPGGGRPAQGDICPGPRSAGVPQPPPGRPRPFRGVPGVREGRGPLPASLRRRAAGTGPRSAPGLCHDPVCAASGQREGPPCSRCNIIMRTWPPAWRNTG